MIEEEVAVGEGTKISELETRGRDEACWEETGKEVGVRGDVEVEVMESGEAG